MNHDDDEKPRLEKKSYMDKIKTLFCVSYSVRFKENHAKNIKTKNESEEPREGKWKKN